MLSVNAKSKPTPTKSERTPAKPLSTNVEPSTRSSPVKRKKPSTLLSSDDEDQPAPPKKRVVSTRRSVGATPNGKNGTKAKVPLPSSDDEEEPPRPVTKTPVKKANGRGKVTASRCAPMVFCAPFLSELSKVTRRRTSSQLSRGRLRPRK